MTDCIDATAATPASDEPTKQWSWWVGSCDQRFHTQCETRAEAVQIAQGECGGGWIVEGTRPNTIQLSNYFDADQFVETAEDNASDDIGDPEGDRLAFDMDAAQSDSLQSTVRAAIDAWQEAEGLKFSAWAFADMRHLEQVQIRRRHPMTEQYTVRHVGRSTWQGPASITAIDTPAVLKRAHERLGGISTPMMFADNLAITLCGAFDNPNQDVDDECGWTPDAIAGCDEALAAIRAHYDAACAEVKREAYDRGWNAAIEAARRTCATTAIYSTSPQVRLAAVAIRDEVRERIRALTTDAAPQAQSCGTQTPETVPQAGLSDMDAPQDGPEWEAFGRAMMEYWDNGDIDSGNLHDLAKRHGFIKRAPSGYDPDRHGHSDWGLDPGEPYFERVFGPQAQEGE